MQVGRGAVAFFLLAMGILGEESATCRESDIEMLCEAAMEVSISSDSR